MKPKSKHEVYIPINSLLESSTIKPNIPSSINKPKSSNNVLYPRTVRLSIPEMQEKSAYNDNRNTGSITYKEPRKEQSPDNQGYNSGKILSNKVKAINMEAADRKRSKSPFIDDKTLLENVKSTYKHMNETYNIERKQSHNYESCRDEKIVIKELLRNNFFKENPTSHGKTSSVHQINYEIKNLLNKCQNNTPLNNNTNQTQSINSNSVRNIIKYQNTPQEDRTNNSSYDKNFKKFKENINETPFASLSKEKNLSIALLNEKKKDNMANEVPISSFINHSNLKNLKVACCSPNFTINMENKGVSKQAFDFKYVIGKGGFGKVWKVEQKKTKTLFAMKEMSKSKVITKRSVNSVMNERELLSVIEHPFIVNMVYAFQDRENLYLVMDLMTGGDLRYHIGRQRRFSEVQTKFFVACILLGLEFLHDKGIIHRDIKPENLVLDKNGYVRITDMGIARQWKLENSSDTSGTPGYMAPEVMCRQNHTVAVDYFAVGVIAYEFMLGKRPYLGRSRKEIRDSILAKQEQVKRNDVPDGWSLEAADFVNKMIQRKPSNRLGTNSPREVKQHPWFKNFPWDKLTKKELMAPFRPNSRGDNFDQKQQLSSGGETNEDLIQQNALLLKRKSVQKLFSGYDYEGTSLPLKKDEENSRSRSSSIAGAKTTINSTSSGSFILNN